jgi:hypothetical protein
MEENEEKIGENNYEWKKKQRTEKGGENRNKSRQLEMLV